MYREYHEQIFYVPNKAMVWSAICKLEGVGLGFDKLIVPLGFY
jgi:hypothetical protein